MHSEFKCYRWHKLFRVVLLMIVAIGYCACGDDSRPGQSDALRQIKQQLESGTDFIKISNLKYENGISKGSNAYDTVVSFDLTFTQSFADIEAKMRTDGNNAENAIDLMAIKMAYGDVKAGDSFHKTGTYHFLKMEKGWQLTGEVAQ